MTESDLATGTYEVLRNRLRDCAADLRHRFQKLNEARSEVFGNVETRLLTTTHVTTDHNCIPRGLFASRSRILLGYNVQFGLKTEIVPSDVLSLYKLEGDHAKQEPLDPILTPQFIRDFQELYRYYRGATFSRFYQNGPNLYMVFQIGKTTSSFKTFKWAVDGEQLHYIDNRSESEVRQAPQFAFQWTRTTRDDHRHGDHPHISINDVVFVECVRGDLTIKVEDNTEDGLGIYREAVDSPDQTLDDAETYFAIVGNLVLLKIRPYQERDFRYLVFSTKRATVTRLDAIGQCCVLLPDDHGIIFPNGFVLQTGEIKLFDHGLNDLAYDRTIKSPNGEDFMFLFSNHENGNWLQLRYNLIRQEVDTPMICQGQALFDDGSMLCMKASESAQKHHAIQIWQTPFTGPEHRPEIQSDSLLFKIGNHELVRGMAQCQEILTLIDKDESYVDLYADLAKRANDALDSYFWLDREETGQLSEPLELIRDAANAAVDEFEKVVRIKRETASSLERAENETADILKSIERSRFERVTDFIEQLASIRSERGRVIQLKELRYIDLGRVETLEKQLGDATDRLGVRCLQFLLSPDSLSPYVRIVDELIGQIPTAKNSSSGKKLEAQFAETSASLELLIETVSQLKIDDLEQRTLIVDRIGDCLAQLNRARTSLKTRIREITSSELEADFGSQSKLLEQSTASALDSADSPDRIDTALTRLLIQIEELEGRYADSEDLLLRLTERRQTLCDLFESKRQQLVEVQTKRANSLVAAADRILTGIASRASRIDDPTELRTYFASDLMVDKVRKIADQLSSLNDSVRCDDVLSRLKTISDDSIRQQRDRRELLSDGNRTIRLGQHAFSVNQQPIELTCVVRNGVLHSHLTGTQFFQAMSAPSLEEARDLWEQSIPSESNEVYRAEYLAYTLACELHSSSETLAAFTQWSHEEQIDWVREQMQTRYDEGYVRGVHDHDAAIILRALLQMQQSLGLQQYPPRLRGLAWFAWYRLVPAEHRQPIERWIRSFAAIDKLIPNARPSRESLLAIRAQLRKHANKFLKGESITKGAEFLLNALRIESSSTEQIAECTPRMPMSSRGTSLIQGMHEHFLAEQWQAILKAIREHSTDAVDGWLVSARAVDAFLDTASYRETNTSVSDPNTDYREELTTALFMLATQSTHTTPTDDWLGSTQSTKPTFCVQLNGLVGDHPKIANGSIELHYHRFMMRLKRFSANVVPRWRSLQQSKQRILEQMNKELKTGEFKAKVLTSFVRNQLIDQVYLPRIGENLAKQMGSIGETKRTDRMGLLLLISPPGYGKTTLMEYIANRLGLVFVKVNGPAIGHAVTSLDPMEASNAASREEVKRINMALEMGDNTMLYLDDIQHCNVELLQKFIPLCDATRRIEGVWDGAPKTYDLRGRKFVVVMAGNPYTETGERFQIPDMLANRADVYNLGEIIGDSKEAFELSYLENCLTSNSTLQPLARLSNADQRAMIQAASRGTLEGLELESNLPIDSVREMFVVLQKLQRVRDVVLRINQTYISSAAQSDDYRTEPPFKLQGSYRNMNRIAEKVVAVMNDDELDRLIVSSYQQDSQTLARDSESNMLRFKELLGILSQAESERWESIKRTYVEKNRLKGLSNQDSSAQFLASILGINSGLESIRNALDKAISLKMVEQNAVPKDPRVIVQHAVPRVMTDLIRSQYQLLYDGLRPVLENILKQSASSENIQASLQELLNRYQILEEASNRTTESSDPSTGRGSNGNQAIL